jgi:hypothetical protein
MGIESGLFRRHSVDFANWCGVAFSAEHFPSPSTCWRRLKQWEEEGVWLAAWRTLLGATSGDYRLDIASAREFFKFS